MRVSSSLPHTSVSGFNKEINKIRKEMGVFFPAGNFLGWCDNSSPPKESSRILWRCHPPSPGMCSCTRIPWNITESRNPEILAASQSSGCNSGFPRCGECGHPGFPHSHPSKLSPLLPPWPRLSPFRGDWEYPDPGISTGHRAAPAPPPAPGTGLTPIIHNPIN